MQRLHPRSLLDSHGDRRPRSMIPPALCAPTTKQIYLNSAHLYIYSVRSLLARRATCDLHPALQDKTPSPFEIWFVTAGPFPEVFRPSIPDVVIYLPDPEFHAPILIPTVTRPENPTPPRPFHPHPRLSTLLVLPVCPKAVAQSANANHVRAKSQNPPANLRSRHRYCMLLPILPTYPLAHLNTARPQVR